jgi:imidazolonepropionase-like amidohydrolase
VPKTALHRVRVFDGRELTEPRTVVIDGSSIGTDPAGAREIDAAGATLLPGFIDAHVHLSAPEQLAELAEWGVTTALDMACWPAERVAALRAAGGPADFRTAGLLAIGPGGPHARMPGMPAEAIVTTPAEAVRFVEAREGSDYIKGVAEAPGDGGPPQEALNALVDAARERGLATVLHAASVGAYRAAVASGARFVTHVPIVGRIADEDVAAMKAAGQTAIPTLTMMAGIRSRFPGGAPSDFVANAAALHAAGIEILAGTDANADAGAPAAVPHGASLHDEFALLAEAGLTAAEVLRAATVGPARAFGLADRGEIRPGRRADLVLVEGDPVADLSATRAIRAVWCAGEETVPAR